MENKIRKYAVVVGLASILATSSSAQAGIFKGSIIDRLFISGPKEKKAKKKLIEYAADGKLTEYEKSQVLKIINNKEVRSKISITERNLKVEAEAREKEEKARAREAARQENERRKSIAERYYHNALSNKSEGNYEYALYSIDKAIEHYPSLKYSSYKSYLEVRQDLKKGGQEFKKDAKKASLWISDKLRDLEYRLRR